MNGANRSRDAQTRPESSSTTRLRLLQVDSFWLGLPEEEILTIEEFREPTPLPFAPQCVLGVVCLLGRMFTVIDPGALIKANGVLPQMPRRIVVALRGDEQLALTADDVTETIESVASSVGRSSTQFIGDVVESDGKNIQVLNTSVLFANVIQGRERRRRRS